MKTELRVRGMSCGHCVARVGSALDEIPAVKRYDISLEEGKVLIETDGSPDIEEIRNKVSESGNYEIEPLP